MRFRSLLLLMAALLMLAGEARAEVHGAVLQAPELYIAPPGNDFGKHCTWSRGKVDIATPEDQASPEALYNRGIFYLDGDLKTLPDPQKAAALFQKVASGNSRFSWMAKVQQAMTLLNAAVGMPSQEKKKALIQDAISILKGALKDNKETVLYTLGQAYARDENFVVAANYYRQSAAAGHVRASLALLNLHFKGLVKFSSPEEAERLLKWSQNLLLTTLAQNKCDDLFTFVKMYYDQELGVENKKLAAQWMEVAAQAGDTHSMLYLGLMYDRGLGLEPDKKRAMQFWKDAAERGSAEGMFHYGRNMAMGGTTKQAKEDGLQWLVESARRGHKKAIESLARIYLGKNGNTPQPEKAFVLLKDAAAKKLLMPKYIYEYAVLYEYGQGTKQNYVEALRYYKEAAEAGNLDATVKIGDFYKYGVSGMAAEPVKSYRFYRLGADLGSADAMEALSENYACAIGKEKNKEWANFWRAKAEYAGSQEVIDHVLDGLVREGTPASMQKAIQLLWRRIAMNSRTAMVTLGMIYQDGLGGIPRNPELAQQWLDRAIEEGQGQDVGLVARAKLLLRNPSEEQAKQAVTLLEKAVELDNDEASYMLAKVYTPGVPGVGADQVRSRVFLLGAAQARNPRAMLDLARALENTDRAGALSWMEKAAEYGSLEAMFLLARAYHEGAWLKQDEAKAEFWTKKAMLRYPCRPEHRYLLARAYAEGVGVKQDGAKALEILQDIADTGEVEAMLEIGYIYLYGRGMNVDEAKALEWFRKAADLGNTEAMMKLGNAYAVGLGVPQDEAAAKQWWKKAADAGNAKAATTFRFSFDEPATKQ